MTSDPTPSRILLCPGQGAQRVGMGKAWFDASPEAAQTFASADQHLSEERFAKTFRGRSLSDICFKGPEDEVNRTDVAQPAIFVASAACWQALVARGEDPTRIAATAGLSLGEYTALYLAGSLTFKDALTLVALRGRAMQDAAEASKGSMVALIGADDAQAQQVCDDSLKALGSGEVLVPANYNAPGQIVLSGSVNACAKAVEVASAMGLRATALSVAGAFHSPLMQPAADRLATALEEVEIKPPKCVVVSNVTSVPHGTGPDEGANVVDSIKRRLVEQLTAPVRWSQSCQWMIANVKGEMHELAPGKVLAGLMRRIDKSVKVTTHDEPGE
jgi:[acyl-carrier-protein] S-malonyltransferase